MIWIALILGILGGIGWREYFLYKRDHERKLHLAEGARRLQEMRERP